MFSSSIQLLFFVDEASDFSWAGDLFIALLRMILRERWRARAIARHKRQALLICWNVIIMARRYRCLCWPITKATDLTVAVIKGEFLEIGSFNSWLLILRAKKFHPLRYLNYSCLDKELIVKMYAPYITTVIINQKF